jgi:hypothetical protein
MTNGDSGQFLMFFFQIVRQIEKLIKAKAMMEAAGKPE